MELNYVNIRAYITLVAIDNTHQHMTIRRTAIELQYLHRPTFDLFLPPISNATNKVFNGWQISACLFSLVNYKHVKSKTTIAYLFVYLITSNYNLSSITILTATVPVQYYVPTRHSLT